MLGICWLTYDKKLCTCPFLQYWLLIISSESNLAKNCSSRHHEAKQKWERSHDNISALSAPGSVLIKITLMKSLPEALWYTRPCSCQNKYWQQPLADREMLRGLKFLEPIHFYGITGAKRLLRMASAFLGKYASITGVDLIQWKKLDFRNFYESNLTEARIEII